jgi:hypothetical protein
MPWAMVNIIILSAMCNTTGVENYLVGLAEVRKAPSNLAMRLVGE